MTLRLEMLQVARLAPKTLAEEGTDLVRDFILSQLHPDGGFMDRAENQDLYYTVFGLNCMLALRQEIPYERMRGYLEGFGNGEELDLIHRCALIRSWATLPGGVPDERAAQMLQLVEEYRAPAGGFNVMPDAEFGTTYGNFMALGAYQDLKREPVGIQELIDGCLALRTDDGGYSNEPGLTVGNTPATAAAESVLRTLGHPIPDGAADWLLARIYPKDGGFFAMPFAPMPDLLSTATALHALSGMGVSMDPFREACLDYIDSLWVNKGAFFGNWADPHLDVEYTFYGLLALGHLSV